MFYSHNLLARKGPLGTVWCAAHLQSKLRKSNYVTVNIPSTVEQIMNPQVPIALRMSGHLLLGVVRIYSKKVEYLQHDYNLLRIELTKACTYADINLPEDANQAKFESITLPDNFALDLLDVEGYNPDGFPDSHLRRHEDISLTDQSPVSLSKNRDQVPAGYIMITLGEDVSSNPSPSRYDSGSRPISMPMETNPHPLSLPETTDDGEDVHPGGLRDPIHDDHLHMPPRTSPEREEPERFIDGEDVHPGGLRDPIHDDLLHMPPRTSPDREEPDLELEEELLKENNNGSPALDEILVSSGHLSPVKQTPSLGLAHSEPANNDNSDPHVSFGLASSVMAVQPSASALAEAAEQPRAKRRKIDYDLATVLTNEFMKKSLDNPGNVLRKRKGVCSSLDVWRLNNTRKKEKVLFDPIITGLCHNLCQTFEIGYMSTSNVEVERLRDVVAPNNTAIPTNTPDNMEPEHFSDFVDPNDNNRILMNSPDNMEAEHLRDFVVPNDNNMIPTHSPGTMTAIPSPNNRSFSSPHLMDESTPAIGTDLGSKSYQTSIRTGVGSTPDPTSNKSFLSDMETPFPSTQGQQGFENSGGLSDIPEVDDAGELTFLEDDEGMPMGLRGTPEADYSSGKQRPPPEIGSLVARTRAVAQYIKEKSSATPSTPERVGAVSLNSILEGKRRKVCARMFFETLVLKSCDLVDVNQDEAYGDITLKVTSKLMKQQF